MTSLGNPGDADALRRRVQLVRADSPKRWGRMTAHQMIFGPLSRAAWRRWGWLHVDHHLRQFGV